MTKQTSPRAFRPSGKNQERLDYADKIGLNVSELINNLLDEHLKPALEKAVRKLRSDLSSPVP